MKEDELRKAMREMGKRGGKRRLETMTPERRSELAKIAGLKGVEAKRLKREEAAEKKPAKKAARPGPKKRGIL